MPALPHENVYVRLGVSPIEGIGAFAVRPIPAGTNLFANDTVAMTWVDRAVVDDPALSEADRRFYHDFCVFAGDTSGRPATSPNPPPGGNRTHPADGGEPNVTVDADLVFTTRRAIAQGEELTVRYTEFSQA